MQFTVRHVFDTDLDTFWQKVFFDPDYNKRLYFEALGFKDFRVMDQRDLGGGTITRTVRLEPGFDAPGPIKKLLGDRFHYIEKGTLDPATRRWKYTVTPSALPDRLTIGGNFWAEARPGKKIERVCEIGIEARIFGVGKMVESFVEKETRSTYEVAARFTNQFIREKGLDH